MTSVVFVGGGGHASVLLDIVRATPTLHVVGYVAPSRGALSEAGLEHLGGDECRDALLARGVQDAVLGIAGANDNIRRGELFAAWKSRGFRFITLIHPSAVISARASHGEGLQCCPRVVVNAGCVIGANVILNTAAVVEHDCHLAADVHIAPGAVLCGGVQVGLRAFVGAGATVLPGMVIGEGAMVGAGSVVTRDVAPGDTVAGVPARSIRTAGAERRKA